MAAPTSFSAPGAWAHGPELSSAASAAAPSGPSTGAVTAGAPETIDAPPPNNEVSLNLLNIFYAIEWVIFAGFAIFLWYRLVKDAWEEENLPHESPAEPSPQEPTLN